MTIRRSTICGAVLSASASGSFALDAAFLTSGLSDPPLQCLPVMTAIWQQPFRRPPQPFRRPYLPRMMWGS